MTNIKSPSPYPPANRPFLLNQGLLLVLSSPSGAGKTTIGCGLLEQDKNITLSVSVTTRAPRMAEREGIDYHFITKEEFWALQSDGALLEYAEVFDNLYGTPRALVESELAAGRDVLFDVDWQGAAQLIKNAPSQVVSIFILPPSFEVLHNRLITRAQDSEETVKKRMGKAWDEMKHWCEYDYIIINTDVGRSIKDVRAILTAERLKRIRQQGVDAFLLRLQKMGAG